MSTSTTVVPARSYDVVFTLEGTERRLRVRARVPLAEGAPVEILMCRDAGGKVVPGPSSAEAFTAYKAALLEAEAKRVASAKVEKERAKEERRRAAVAHMVVKADAGLMFECRHCGADHVLILEKGADPVLLVPDPVLLVPDLVGQVALFLHEHKACEEPVTCGCGAALDPKDIAVRVYFCKACQDGVDQADVS